MIIRDVHMSMLRAPTGFHSMMPTPNTRCLVSNTRTATSLKTLDWFYLGGRGDVP